MRESDGTHFLWNGEGCVRVSPLEILGRIDDVWHHHYGELPNNEIELLNSVLGWARHKVFTIKGHGRYQVIARGEFKGL